MVINRTVCAGFGLLITAGDLETLGEEKGQLFDKAYWISGVQKLNYYRLLQPGVSRVWGKGRLL